MNLNDSINALFQNGVTAITLKKGPAGECVLTCEQQHGTQNGSSQFRHQIISTDWVDAVSKTVPAVDHCASMQARIIRGN